MSGRWRSGRARLGSPHHDGGACLSLSNLACLGKRTLVGTALLVGGLAPVQGISAPAVSVGQCAWISAPIGNGRLSLACHEEGRQRAAVRAQSGDIQAMVDLGLLDLSPPEKPRNPDEGLNWLRKAAAAGDPIAMFSLGVMYAEGRGVPKDDAEAIRWYGLAAKVGNTLAMTNLGAMYGEGRGVTRDEVASSRWYLAGADGGSVPAMFAIGVRYAEGRGVPQSDAEALRWYQAAANHGDADAMANLGEAYATGRGVRQDAVEAVRWARSAADLGHPIAMYNLGFAYASGEGVNQDYVAASRWYLAVRRCQGHVVPAMNALGSMYAATGLACRRTQCNQLGGIAPPLRPAMQSACLSWVGPTIPGAACRTTTLRRCVGFVRRPTRGTRKRCSISPPSIIAAKVCRKTMPKRSAG